MQKKTRELCAKNVDLNNAKECKKRRKKVPHWAKCCNKECQRGPKIYKKGQEAPKSKDFIVLVLLSANVKQQAESRETLQ